MEFLVWCRRCVRTHKQRTALTAVWKLLFDLVVKTRLQKEKKRWHGFAFCQSLTLLGSWGIIEGVFTNPGGPHLFGLFCKRKKTGIWICLLSVTYFACGWIFQLELSKTEISKNGWQFRWVTAVFFELNLLNKKSLKKKNCSYPAGNCSFFT